MKIMHDYLIDISALSLSLYMLMTHFCIHSLDIITTAKCCYTQINSLFTLLAWWVCWLVSWLVRSVLRYINSYLIILLSSKFYFSITTVV